MSPEQAAAVAAQQVFNNVFDHGTFATSKEEFAILHETLKTKDLEWWLLQKNTKECGWTWSEEQIIQLMMNEVTNSQWSKM